VGGHKEGNFGRMKLLISKLSVDFPFFGFFLAGGPEDEIWENRSEILIEMSNTDVAICVSFRPNLFHHRLEQEPVYRFRLLSPHTRAQRGAQQ
jgi:hypothetical protein